VKAARRAAAAAAATLAGALALGGCGGSSPRLKVAAAASLRQAFGQYARQLKGESVRFSFAGSDALAAQIQQGVHPDVFASANRQLPDMLYARRLVSRPVIFAANRLVVAVPRGSRITGLAALERPGVTISAGASTVPVGSYTTKALSRLPPAQRGAILANIRDREPDVTGIVGKLLEGAVDAGLLYASDVTATSGRLQAIELPLSLQPEIAYEAAVVRGAAHPARARRFISGLLRGAGRAELLRAGFLSPPGR
jgi:molybdate transport system substrate-binding protein